MDYSAAESIIRRTIREGGSTFTAEGIILDLAEGYIVASFPQLTESITKHPDDSFHVSYCSLGLQVYVAENDSAVYGTWIEGDTLFFDCVEWMEGREASLKVAAACSQQAIYDCENRVSVYVQEGQ